MNDLEEEEQLLMEVAGQRKPTKTPGKKRKRRSISISEDEESYSGGSEEGELDEDEQEENIPRSRVATDIGNKAQRTQDGKAVSILCGMLSRISLTISEFCLVNNVHRPCC